MILVFRHNPLPLQPIERSRCLSSSLEKSCDVKRNKILREFNSKGETTENSEIYYKIYFVLLPIRGTLWRVG